MNFVFTPGQRWISNTEADLGLGIVEQCDGRRLTVSFPAASEQRTYAIDNAPLTRVLYPVGEVVSTVGGVRLTVTQRIEHAMLVRYSGIDEHGETRVIDEADLDSFAQFSRPQDRLLAGRFDPVTHFVLRVATLEHRYRHARCAAFGLLGARVALLAHQLYIAAEVGARHAPRVLLADEVGLGKTIEAGLIVHQQLVSGRAQRVLFVVPDALLHQWLVEMRRRFNLYVTILDDERCEALQSADDSNPFHSAQLVLCPLSTISRQAPLLEQASAAGWDLLVVDEAHHLHWQPDGASAAYQAIEVLASRVPGVLLLTATPEQRGAQGHFARLRLLDPDRYPDVEQFRRQEADYQAISDLVQRLLCVDERSHPDVMAQVEQRLGAAVADELRANHAKEPAQAAIERAVRALLDRHGTGRVLFRNTREAIGGFPARRMVAHCLEAALEPGSGGGGAISGMLDPARALGEDWLQRDARVSWLAGFLRARGEQRTLVICARAATARDLEAHLRLREGLRTAVFHEDMALLARDRAAAYFTEPGSDGAQVLICSEIGSEGRNFQQAGSLVLFDLPLDPELLEQRIGRLDRIGQHSDVEIHVPYHQGGADHALLRWYHEGLGAFERPCSIGERMRELFADELLSCLEQGSDEAQLESLILTTRQVAQSTLSALESGRDRLLELGSCDAQRAAEIVQAVAQGARSAELAQFMDGVFDLFGVDHEADGAHNIVIRPGTHMLCDEFPELPEDGVKATFVRAQALAREDLAYLTWEHPMVSGAMDLLLDGELGNAALCTFKSLPLKAGTLLLEAVFVVHCPAPRALQLRRWLPAELVRHVVASDGRDLTAVFSAAALDARVLAVAQDTARNVLRHAWVEIEKLVTRAQRLANEGQAAIVAAALAEAERSHAVELERLKALAQVNPNIRAEEIAHLKAQAGDVRSHLEGAQLRLDAVRVGVVT